MPVDTINLPLGSGRIQPVAPGLARRLSLTHAVLYGLGVTIGAGIYVLVGAAAGSAGWLTPPAFVFAAVLMAFTAASFAELAGRMPVAAGEAEYLRRGFGSERLATAAGIVVIAIAVISAAAISLGSAGYISAFVSAPGPLITAAVVLAMGVAAAWGIKESIAFAGVMTVVEVGGLLVIVAAAVLFGSPAQGSAGSTPFVLPEHGLAGVMTATLFGVFAFIGFEGLANIAEEVEEPERTLPRAIFITLALTTVLYVLVVSVALLAATPADLANSPAPLALVFERLTGTSPRIMSAIAIMATLNGIVVQIIMASRVIYGLSRQGNLPAALGSVHRRTRTPLLATALAVTVILVLALAVPLTSLAEITSRLTLLVFALVNAALIRIKRREPPAPSGTFIAPAWVPWAGLVTTLAFLIADAITGI
jgi:basic amino acid/polyamine antiporter, APA family